jgi:hypothetical protein
MIRFSTPSAISASQQPSPNPGITLEQFVSVEIKDPISTISVRQPS